MTDVAKDALVAELVDALRGMMRATDHWNDWEPGAKERDIAARAIERATSASSTVREA